MEITLDDVKAFLDTNKDIEDVKAFVKSLVPETKITSDMVVDFLGTPDGEKIVEKISQPIADSRVTDAVKKRDKFWKEEGVEAEVKKRVAAEVLKMNPKADPNEARFKELQDKIDAAERQATQDRLKRQVIEKANALGVAPFYMENYMPSSLEENELFMQKIIEHDKDIAQKAVNDLIASKNFVPNGGKTKQTAVDLSKLSKQEIMELDASGELDKIITG